MTITKDQIVTYISETFNVDGCNIAPTTSLFSTGVLDSFSMVDLVSYIEKTAGVKFGALDLNLNNLDTIEGMIKFVDRKTAKA